MKSELVPDWNGLPLAALRHNKDTIQTSGARDGRAKAPTGLSVT